MTENRERIEEIGREIRVINAGLVSPENVFKIALDTQTRLSALLKELANLLGYKFPGVSISVLYSQIGIEIAEPEINILAMANKLSTWHRLIRADKDLLITRFKYLPSGKAQVIAILSSYMLTRISMARNFHERIISRINEYKNLNRRDRSRNKKRFETMNGNIPPFSHLLQSFEEALQPTLSRLAEIFDQSLSGNNDEILRIIDELFQSDTDLYEISQKIQ